MSLWETKRSR